MRKWARGQLLAERAQVNPRGGMIKDAARHQFQFEPREGYLYVPSRMISSRVNDNWDGFPAKEIADDRPGYGWQTFLGKPAFVNHHNANHRKARGVIVDAVLHEHENPDGSPDTWVEGLHEIDALTYPKLAQAILAKKIERTSMGVDVDYSVCSACGNKATDTFSYCQHIPGQKGRKFFASGQPGRYIYEVCHGLKFFENSLLVEPPADPTAVVTGGVVTGPGLEHLTAGLQRTASRERITVTSFRAVDAGPQFADLGLVKEAARYNHPSDHPWFQASPVHPQHIVDHWNQATDDEKASGKRWYADAHLVGKSIAKLAPVRPGKKESDPDARHPLGDAHLGASALAIYSPQQGWAGNMHNAARALHEGKGIGGPGSGMFASKSQANSMDKVLGGAHMHEAVSGPKIRDFGHLIEHGGDEHPPDHPDYQAHVVIDRHALGVATGKRLTDKEYGSAPVAAASRRKDGTIPRSAGYDHVVNAYHQASKQISEQEGEHVPGHAVQAVTWLVRQRLNQEGEKNATGNDVRLNKGRQVSRTKAEQGWQDFSKQHGIEHAGPGTGYVKESKAVVAKGFASPREGNRRTAYGEQVAPPKVDTLREENCPICGEDNAYNGNQCRVCGFVAPPSPFNDPNLDKAKQIDLRQEQNAFVQSQAPDPDREMADEQGGTLVCPVCGTEFPQEPPETVDTGEAAPDVAAGESEEGMGAAEGDLCPACGKGVLEAQDTVEGEDAAEGAVDPEAAEEGEQQGEDEQEPPFGGGEAEPDDEDEDDRPGVAVKSTDGPIDDEADAEDPDDEDDAPPVPKSKKKPNQ